jgi:integrase
MDDNLSTALVPFAQQELILDATAKARDFAANSKAPATIRAYRACWDHFQKWCAKRGLPSLPAAPGTVALFIADCASAHKPASISLRMAAISAAHKLKGYESPALMRHAVVAATWAGIRRTLGTAQQGKAALLTDDIRKMIDALPATLRGLRDAALFLVGFASACRRSELAALTVDDLAWVEEGLRITLKRSKTDQEGKGQTIGVPYGSDPATCPVRAMKRWLAAAGITEGFAFRGVLKGGRVQVGRMAGDSIALCIKRGCTSIGKETAQYAGHSLRAGFVTQAARAGCSESSIMKQTRHRSTAMLVRYTRDPNLFRNNAATKLGL